MKKVILCAAVAFAAVAGTFCYNNESENEMSDLAKANVKALAGSATGVLPSWCTALCEERQDAFCHCRASLYHGYGFKKIIPINK